MLEEKIDREIKREKAKVYREANKDKAKVYRDKNRDKINAYNRKYRKENKERLRILEEERLKNLMRSKFINEE